MRKQWEKDELTHFSIQMMELLGSLPKSLQKELAEDLPWELTSCDCYKELNSLIERDYSCRLDDAPFPMDDPRFYGSCGGECSNNSESSPLLFSFDEKDKKDCSRCLNTSCFFTRLNKWRTHKLTEIEKGETKLIYFTKQRSVEITREDGSTIRPIQDWQLASKCGLQLGKKSDENSRRAINLTNPDKPTNAYLVPIAKASTSTTASNTVPQDSEELKRNRFQARRWKLVYEQFCEAIRTTDCEQVTANVFEVAAFFGLSYSLRHRSEEDWKGFSKRDHPQGFRGHSLSVEGKLNLQQHVWQGLKSIFISRLDHHRVIDCLDIIPEMKRISELIGYDLEKAKKEADEQIPPPKSWGEVDVHTLKRSA